jgi:hypothetical protein
MRANSSPSRGELLRSGGSGGGVLGLSSPPSTPRTLAEQQGVAAAGGAGAAAAAEASRAAELQNSRVAALQKPSHDGSESTAGAYFEPEPQAAQAAGNLAINHSERNDYCAELCATLGALIDSPDLCDVAFVVGLENESEVVHGVRAILAARSKVFRSMLFGEGWREQSERSGSRMQQIDMPDNGPEAFRAMVRYVHSGSVTFEPSTVMEVLQLADYFALDELKAGCGEYIAKTINTETAAVLLQTAHTFGEKVLVDKCVQFIEAHTDAVLASEAFREAGLSPELLCTLLQSDALTCTSELALYRATVAWGRAYCARHPGISLNDALSEPLRHIRLPLIPTSGLMGVVRPDGLVAVDLLLEALAYHSDPGTVDGSRTCFIARTGTQLLEVALPQWDAGYMSFLSSSGGHYYEFSANRRTATKARNDGTIQSLRAAEPLEPGKVHTFAFHIDKWVGGDIDVGFGVDCGSKLAWLRQNECPGGDWVVSQPAICEGDTIVVVVDMLGGTALFRKQNGTVLKTVSGVEGGIMYPAAAFRRVGTRVSFVEPVSDNGTE